MRKRIHRMDGWWEGESLIKGSLRSKAAVLCLSETMNVCLRCHPPPDLLAFHYFLPTIFPCISLSPPGVCCSRDNTAPAERCPHCTDPWCEYEVWDARYPNRERRKRPHSDLRAYYRKRSASPITPVVVARESFLPRTADGAADGITQLKNI